MPKEIRYLLFSNEELYQALIADLRARSQPMPKGYLKNIHLGTPDNPDVTLVYVNDKNIESSFRFEDQDVLRALIVYCGYRRIPLSAKSVKMLEIKDGVVGLLCTLNFNNDKIAATGGKVSYQDDQTDSMKNAAKAVAAVFAATKAPAAPMAKLS
jgi:hypothetical protein